MMTSLMATTGLVTAFDESLNAFRSSRPRVRVIYGRGLGSTYQGFYPALPGSGASQHGGGSHFSRPLTCPVCTGSLELVQPDAGSPDRLAGTCCRCDFSCRLDIGSDGRITLS